MIARLYQPHFFNACVKGIWCRSSRRDDPNTATWYPNRSCWRFRYAKSPTHKFIFSKEVLDCYLNKVEWKLAPNLLELILARFAIVRYPNSQMLCEYVLWYFPHLFDELRLWWCVLWSPQAEPMTQCSLGRMSSCYGCEFVSRTSGPPALPQNIWYMRVSGVFQITPFVPHLNCYIACQFGCWYCSDITLNDARSQWRPGPGCGRDQAAVQHFNWRY